MSGRAPSIARTGVMALMCVPFVYPFLFLLATSLKTTDAFQQDSSGLIPREVTLDKVTGAWTDAGMSTALLHSVVAVGLGVTLVVALSTLGAFWLLLHRGRAARLVHASIIATMALPVPVFIVPLFISLADLGLVDNLLVLGVIYAAWNAGFGLFLTHTYLRGLPVEVLEAAVVDGATPWQLFRRVVLPLSKPVLATVAVLAFMWSWSDLLISVVVIQDPELRPVTAAVALLADRYSSDIPSNAAGVLIALIPMLAVFLVGQRFLIRGITAGVGK